MPWIDEGRYWVGRHESHGLVLFAKGSTSVADNNVPVYFLDQDRIAICNREVMRQHTNGKTVSIDEAHTVLDSFLTMDSRQLEQKNRRFLEKRGKKFSGTRLRKGNGPARVTHCFACKNGLDNSVNVECISCGWILCQCGACGCAYESTLD